MINTHIDEKAYKSLLQELEQYRKQHERLRLLFNVTRNITRELTIDRLLLRIMDEVKNVLNCDRCSVFIMDDDLEHYAISHIQIGILSDFIVHAAAARGLQTGFCQCHGDELTPEQHINIKNKLKINDSSEIRLLLGLGHGIKEESMIHPFNKKPVKCYARVDRDVDPEFEIDSYIKFL